MIIGVPIFKHFRVLFAGVAACSSEKNKEADCFACVISTHGSEEPEKQRRPEAGQTVYQHCVFGSDGIPVYLNDIVETVSEYRSPHLAGKPKLFFVQVQF